MRYLKLFFLGACLSCLALQCDKDGNNEPKDVTRLSEEFKSYAYFKEGSWWVYKELSSGNLDSAYVTRSDILVEHLPEKSGGPEDYEKLSMDVVRKFKASDNKDTIVLEGTPGIPSSSKVGKRVTGNLHATMYSYGIVRATLIKLHHNSSDTLIDPYLRDAYKLDSMTIQGMVYNDVYVAEHKEKEESETNDLIKTDIYAKNVGLIRREFWDGRVKELLRYNVKQ